MGNRIADDGRRAVRKITATLCLLVAFSANSILLKLVNAECKKSEFQCQNGHCIPSNRFCNSVNDCSDNSDEPRFCTPCNRTFYGEVGITYEMEIHRPKIGQLPFVCSLSFAAGGGLLGDIVQVTFGRFTLGKFESFTGNAGCQDGELQISESERPFVGGSWCGSSVKPTHYFSETSTVKLTIKLNKLPVDSSDYNYDIKLIYRMLPKEDSVIRYGQSQKDKSSKESTNNNNTSIAVSSSTRKKSSTFLGDLISGTYCSRIFSDCDQQKSCRLQSPNFPGLYPRNLTCYYAVRQHAIPEGKYALIGIQQKRGQLISVQSIQYTEDKHETHLKFWKDCDLVQDYVTIYDGYTTRDPILLKFCGGGSTLPEIISSGPELLVEFTTSPYGTMLNPTHLLPVHGFQLEVQVHFVNQHSSSYAHNKRCEFWIQGAGNGIIESPKHTLPPNTTCLYHLQGHEPGSTPPAKYQDVSRWKTYTRYKVWLSVLKFYVSSSIASLSSMTISQSSFSPSHKVEHDCSTRLQIWNTNIRSPTFCQEPCNETTNEGNEHLLAKFCRNLIPKICEHSIVKKSSRPCSLSESYLSSNNALTLELKTTESTALRSVSFRVLYEFVDLHQDGEPWGTDKCSRRFQSRTQASSNTPQPFGSPKDVFLFGRGGATDINCTLRFEAQRGERIKITINNLMFGNRSSCTTNRHVDSAYTQCIGNDTATLMFWEIPFAGEGGLPKGCLCSNAEPFLPFVHTSSSNVIHLDFTVKNMNFTDDYRHYFFNGLYEFVRSPVCTQKHIVTGASGEIHLRSPSRTPDEVNCENSPWLIKPTKNHYLYVKLYGVIMPGFGQIMANVSSPVICSTNNRVIIHSGYVSALVCPLPVPAQRHHIVEVFSEGWVIGTNQQTPLSDKLNYRKRANRSRNIIIEYLHQEAGSYHVSWLELSKPRLALSPVGLPFYQEECFHQCPELNACINSSLWCDGIEHCPSGYDESFAYCFVLFRLPALYLLLIAVVCFVVAVSCLVIGHHIYKQQKSVGSSSAPASDTEAIFGPREVIC